MIVTLLRDFDFTTLVSVERLIDVAQALPVAVLGFIILRVTIVFTRRLLRRSSTAQVTMLVTKAINYTGIAIIGSALLVQLGVNLTPILGAAGIVGLAVGIASQASLSNIISGLFLVSEKPFSIGDAIRIDDIVGIVESIDLLSVKIRTFDNLFVRVPNEKLAGSQLTNITRYPIRRLDITFVVPFDADLKVVSELLSEIAAANADCLQEPAPLILPDRHVDYGTQVLFGVWFAKSDFLTVKRDLYTAISTRFAAAGIRFATRRPGAPAYASDNGAHRTACEEPW